QAALTERGTDRRRGVGLAGLHLQLDVTHYFLSHCLSPGASACLSQAPHRSRKESRAGFASNESSCSVASGLLDLPELQLHRSGTTEDQHRHAQAALLVIDFLDRAVEVVERAVADAHQLARLEQDLRARLVDAV